MCHALHVFPCVLCFFWVRVVVVCRGGGQPRDLDRVLEPAGREVEHLEGKLAWLIHHLEEVQLVLTHAHVLSQCLTAIFLACVLDSCRGCAWDTPSNKPPLFGGKPSLRFELREMDSKNISGFRVLTLGFFRFSTWPDLAMGQNPNRTASEHPIQSSH